MQKKKMFFISALMILSLAFSSCKKENGNKGNARQVKFEVTGNFSGGLQATYITASGGATYEDMSALPWTKEINYDASVSGTTISIAGGGGVQGQTVSVKIYSGGVLKSTTPATADSNGSIAVTGPAIHF